MERTTSLTALRTKMLRAGIKQVELARASGIPQSDISAIFNGRRYCGAKRTARLQDALHRLAAEKAQRDADAQPPTPRVRRLA